MAGNRGRDAKCFVEHSRLPLLILTMEKGRSRRCDRPFSDSLVSPAHNAHGYCQVIPRRLARHQDAAVDVDGLSCHCCALFAGKIDGKRRHLVRF